MHWDERNNLWVISKYEDVSYVERQPELFCSGQGIRPKGGGAGNLSIVSLDDPEHARQRRLVSRGFTPSRISQMFDHVRELARGLVDAVAARGECDFVEDIAKPLPLIVIAELLGLPVEDRQQLGEWSDTMMSAEGAEDETIRKLQAAARGVGGVRHLSRRAARGRGGPTRKDDLISILLSSADSGALQFHEDELQAQLASGALPMSDLTGDELLMFCVLLLVAGNETTRNALSGGIDALSRGSRTSGEQLVADLSLVEQRDRGDPPLRVAGDQLLAHGDGRHRAARPHLIRRATCSSTSTRRRTATPTCSTIRTRSASTARRTCTSRSGPVRTSASAPTSPAPRSASCSRSCSAGCPTCGSRRARGRALAELARHDRRSPPGRVHAELRRPFSRRQP